MVQSVWVHHWLVPCVRRSTDANRVELLNEWLPLVKNMTYNLYPGKHSDFPMSLSSSPYRCLNRNPQNPNSVVI